MLKKFSILLSALLLCVGCNSAIDTDPVNPNHGNGLRFVVLENKLARTPEIYSVVGKDAFWESLRKEGHQYRIIDAVSNKTLPDDLAKYVEKNGLPSLVVSRLSDGKVIKDLKLPEKTESIQKLADALSGDSVEGGYYAEKESGIVRKLGVRRPTEEMKSRWKKRKSFGDFLKAKHASLIPKELWKDVEHPGLSDPKFVLNQRRSSGCVGWSGAAAVMKTFALSGYDFSRLSGASLYCRINHGSDSGAYILDAMDALKEFGVCLESEFDYPKLFLHQLPESARASAATRQMVVAYPVQSLEELATALQMGLVVQAGVEVNGAFENFDSHGVSAASGQYANHSIHLYGMKKIGEEWVFLMGNTWGEQWGPWANGSCYLRSRGIVIEGDAFVHVDIEWQPDQKKKGRRNVENPFAVAM